MKNKHHLLKQQPASHILVSLPKLTLIIIIFLLTSQVKVEGVAFLTAMAAIQRHFCKRTWPSGWSSGQTWGYEREKHKQATRRGEKESSPGG